MTPADRGLEPDAGPDPGSDPGPDPKPVEPTDLDDLIGSWREDPEFDRAIADFERIDADAWT